MGRSAYLALKKRLENPPASIAPGIVTRFRPSNGDHGLWFEGRFCDRCEHDREWNEHERNPCESLGRALAFTLADWGYPREWIEEEWRGPRCTAFEPLRRKEAPHPLQPVRAMVAYFDNDFAAARAFLTGVEAPSVHRRPPRLCSPQGLAGESAHKVRLRDVLHVSGGADTCPTPPPSLRRNGRMGAGFLTWRMRVRVPPGLPI